MMCPDTSRAARMAYRLLLREGSGALPVDPGAMLRRCRNTEVMTWQEIADRTGVSAGEFAAEHTGMEAVTLLDPDTGRRIVAARTDGNLCRLRFTLAHELGHITLRHTAQGEYEEREADCFASHLLVPRTVVRTCMARGPVYAEQLERLFFVSRSMLMLAARERFALPEGVDTEALDGLFAASVPDPLPGGEPRFGWVRIG